MLEINLHLLEGTLAVYSVAGIFLYFLSKNGNDYLYSIIF